MTLRGFTIGLAMAAVALLAGLFVMLAEVRDQNREIISALRDLDLEVGEFSGIMAGKAGAAFTINGEARK